MLYTMPIYTPCNNLKHIVEKDALLCFIHFFTGFAELLQTHFQQYELKLLRKVSELLIYKRVSQINFILKEKKRIKNEENGAETNSIRHGKKIAQYKDG